MYWKCSVCLQRLPSPLPEDGGRVFVETKDGILPLLGVCPLTPVTGIKHLLEGLTGIPVSQQLLSTVGRVMHDEFLVRDFDGLNEIHENSIIDLCRSGMFETQGDDVCKILCSFKMHVVVWVSCRLHATYINSCMCLQRTETMIKAIDAW